MSRLTVRAFAFALVSLLFTLTLIAASMEAVKGVPSGQQRVFGAPPLRASAAAATVVASLDALTAEDIAAMRAANATGRGPARVGVVRELVEPVIASRGVSAAAHESFRWRGSVHVPKSQALRLKLTDIDVPSTATFWVYGTSGEAYGFDSSIAHQGTIWTPSVDGDTITIEVETTGAAAAPFTISAVADIRLRDVFPEDSSCFEDAKCYNGLDELGSAIAHMQYISAGDAVICTGGLIADRALSFTPFFLTANHCISTSAEAASLETFWDYKTSACDSTSFAFSHKRTGASILATDPATDVTLLRLATPPQGTRYFLGWTTVEQAVGTTLFRVSHPEGEPQRLSTSTVNATSGACQEWPRPKFLYSTHVVGAPAGGSSGSPVVNGSAQIVGQLAGACGPEPGNPCNHANRTSDGAFSQSYALLKPHIDPSATGCGTCVPDANTACMLNGRFKVTLTWNDPSANLSGNGRIISYAENRPITNPVDGEVSQVTFWSMYPNDPFSVEALVRMIRGINSFWIFTTGFAAAEYTVTILDTQKCTTWQRTSPFGATEKIADYNGLPF